ncbi:MAG: hypothetical protein M0Z91_07565 [Actinomycetota bacterium]|nr:hypothetical protein [Actinomycetota bacterium]
MFQRQAKSAAAGASPERRRVVPKLVVLVVDGLVPLLPGLLEQLWRRGDPDSRSRGSTPEWSCLLRRLLHVDSIYLIALIASGVAWSIWPIPSGSPIVGGILNHLSSRPLVGVMESAGLGIALLSLIWRLVAFVGIAAWIVFPTSAVARLSRLPPLGRLGRHRPSVAEGETTTHPAPRSLIRFHLAALVVYLVLEAYFAVTTKIGIHLATGLISEHSADPVAFLWFLGWWPFAFAHHLNPFHTSLVWAPQGFDLAWTTPIPSLSVLTLPLTQAAGAIVSYNALTIMAAPLAAYAAFLLANELGITRWFALGTGLIYGFSPYLFSQERGHLNLIIAFVPPLLGVIWLRFRRKRLGRAATIILLAIALAFQFGVSNEIFATTCLFFALLLVADWGRHRGDAGRAMNGGDWATAALGLVGSLVLLAPYLAEMVLHLRTTPVNAPAYFSNDIYGIIFPSPLSPFGTTFQGLTRGLLEKGSELDGYISLPLLLLFAFFAVRAFRSKKSSTLLRTLAVFGIASLAISLGPQLQVRGQFWLPLFSSTASVSAAIMPWSLPAKFPILANILPDRISMYTALFLGLTIMGGLQELRLARKGEKLPRRKAGTGYVALAVLAIVGVVADLPWTQKSTLGFPIDRTVVPALFSSPGLSRCIPPSSVALFLPFGGAGYAIADQLAADYRFSMAGGYLGTTPRRVHGDALFAALSADMPLPPGMRTDFASVLLQHGINTLVVSTGVGTPWTSYVSALGPSFPVACSSGGVIVYRHK